MFKLCGAILIIGSTSLAGFIWAMRLAEHCELLKAWIRVLDIFQTEIYYQNRLLPDIFKRVSEMSDDFYLADLFRKMAGKLSFGSGHGVSEIWERLVLERVGFLTAVELSSLLDLGTYLGNTDRFDQIEKIKACKADLELYLKQAEEQRDTKTSLFRYLGFAIGAVAVLWLI